jgi:hypothetical protein
MASSIAVAASSSLSSQPVIFVEEVDEETIKNCLIYKTVGDYIPPVNEEQQLQQPATHSSSDLSLLAYSLALLIVEGRNPTPVTTTNSSTSGFLNNVDYVAKENVHASQAIKKLQEKILNLCYQTGDLKSSSVNYQSSINVENVHSCSSDKKQVYFQLFFFKGNLRQNLEMFKRVYRSFIAKFHTFLDF